MAYSAATGFRYRESLTGVHGNPTVIEIIIAASATMAVGDIVRVNTTGVVKRAGSTEEIGGVCIGLVDQNGVSVFSPRASTTSIAGCTLTGDDTVAVSSTNLSDATRQVKAQVALDPAGLILWYNKADSALAQTNLFQMFDVATSNQVTVGSASDANGQLQLIKLDPDNDGDTSKGLFRINENQFGNGLDTATAKVSA